MKIINLVKNAAKNWIEDSGTVHCAAIAYYTVFSIAPLLIISIGIAAFVFGKEASQGQLYTAIHGLLGNRGAAAIEAMVQSASKDSKTGLIATIIGMVTLLLGASGVFGQLQQSLNSIWKVRTKPDRGLGNLIRQRLITFSMVLVIGFLLLVSLIVSAVISGLEVYLRGKLPGGGLLWHGVNFIVSLAATTFLFGAIFKILPDVRLSWKNVGVGALVTALLFNIGKLLIGFYLGQSSVASSYGAAGSLIIVLLWVFYASAILLFGAEFTRVYTLQSGEKIFPKEGAEFLECTEVETMSGPQKNTAA